MAGYVSSYSITKDPDFRLVVSSLTPYNANKNYRSDTKVFVTQNQLLCSIDLTMIQTEDHN